MATRTLEKKTKVVKAIKVIKKVLAEKPKTKKVIFTYFAPEAKEVFVAGTFNNWNENKWIKNMH